MLLCAVARSLWVRGACLQSAFAPWPHLSGEQCSIGFQPVSVFTADGPQDRQGFPRWFNGPAQREQNTGWKPMLLCAVARSLWVRGACLQSALAPWPHLSGEQCSIGFQPVSVFTADGHPRSSTISALLRSLLSMSLSPRNDSQNASPFWMQTREVRVGSCSQPTCLVRK